VRPHERAEDLAPAPAAGPPRAAQPTGTAGQVVRVGVIGAISRIKGFDVLVACAEEAKRRNLPLRFTVIGFGHDDRRLRRLGVTVTGRYRNEQVPELIEAHALDLLWLPSVWPETYCYALSLALCSGRPVAAFDLGAIAARWRRLDRPDGLMPLDLARDPAALTDRLLALAAGARPAQDTPTRAARVEGLGSGC
jgi:O-antigen biosynthesis protein